MNDHNDLAFKKLFAEACEKCFGHAVTTGLSETDSKALANKILEQTGLVIGVKSIKNYSLYVFNTKEGRRENPSIATLDTLARFVLEAPYTNEVTRKDHEGHFPYWFQYKALHSGKVKKDRRIALPVKKVAIWIALIVVIVIVALLKMVRPHVAINFRDEFNSVKDDSLRFRGWTVQTPDLAWWNRRDSVPGQLSLYTLLGDNWPEENPVQIRNLLVREVPAECFTSEIHFNNFFPTRNWQQAGILLSENAEFKGKVLRMSISYNDFFGGYSKPPEILVQCMSSVESGSKSKPEEFAHIVLFTLDSSQAHLARKNLMTSALKVEKNGSQFRFLYATGEEESFAFHEAVSRQFDIEPKYIGLFAIQGNSSSEDVAVVRIEAFQFSETECTDPSD